MTCKKAKQVPCLQICTLSLSLSFRKDLELQTQLQFAANTFWFGSPPEDANQSISPNQLFLCIFVFQAAQF